MGDYCIFFPSGGENKIFDNVQTFLNLHAFEFFL